MLVFAFLLPHPDILLYSIGLLVELFHEFQRGKTWLIDLGCRIPQHWTANWNFWPSLRRFHCDACILACSRLVVLIWFPHSSVSVSSAALISIPFITVAKTPNICFHSYYTYIAGELIPGPKLMNIALKWKHKFPLKHSVQIWHLAVLFVFYCSKYVMEPNPKS